MSSVNLYIKRLRRAITCKEENSFRCVILRRLLETAQARAREGQELMRQVHDGNLQHRHSRLIELGIDEQDVLEVQNSHDRLPTLIQIRVQLRKAREKEIQEKKHEDLAKIRKVFFFTRTVVEKNRNFPLRVYRNSQQQDCRYVHAIWCTRFHRHFN